MTSVPKNILITGVGGPTPRSFAHALKDYGQVFKNAKLIGTDIHPLAIGLYQKELFEETLLIPRADAPNYWEVIEDLIEKFEIDVAVVLPELEVVQWGLRQKEDKLPCKALIAQHEINELLVNKAKMTALLDGLGLVPPSVAFKANDFNVEEIFHTLGNEFWVRSSSGTSGLGSLLVKGKEALANWIQINPGVKEFLASQYLPGRNLACKLLYWKGNLVRSACAERVHYIMSKVAPSGITGNTSFGRLLNEPELVEEAEKAMNRIFSHTQSEKHGFYTVDFKEDDLGKAYITEINVRHVAFTQCFAAGGANLAEDSLRLLMEDQTFDQSYRMYEFPKDLIFLRDVDERPVLMKESDLCR